MKKPQLIVAAGIPVLLMSIFLIIAHDIFKSIVYGFAAIAYLFQLIRLFGQYQKATAVDQLYPLGTNTSTNASIIYKKIKRLILIGIGFSVGIFSYFIFQFIFRFFFGEF